MTNMKNNLHQMIDHTNLKPDATEVDIQKLCDEAVKYNFYAVCINPVWVSFAKNILSSTHIKIVTVAGFPLGANRTKIKTAEAVQASSDGADEIDMVANIGWIKSSALSKVENEIQEMRKNLPYNKILKVIVEGSKLSELELIESAKAVVNGGAQFVKTSTGFFGGATVEMVATLNQTVGQKIEIKAAGGIKTYENCMKLIDAGASRIGSSASIELVKPL